MLIVHHWDCDGISSAALLKKYVNNKSENVCPNIGDFCLDERITNLINNHDTIYFVDLNILDHVEKITSKKIIFYDHHIQKKTTKSNITQINPIICGKSVWEYPSATFVISENIKKWDFLSLLGAVGDIGKKAFYIKKVKKLIDIYQLSQYQILKMVELIDSNYIIMDRDKVIKAVDVLCQIENPKDILNYESWIKNLELINKEIERILSKCESNKDFVFVSFASKYNIISKVCRNLIWEKNNSVALVINENFNNNAQIYLRIKENLVEKINIKKLIEMLKPVCISIGGKDTVFGAIANKEMIVEIKEIITDYLAR